MGIFTSLFKPNVEKLKVKKDFPGLLAALSNKDANVRKDAAMALGDIGNIDFIDQLINALKDPFISVQKEAVLSLGKMKNEKAARALIFTLANKDLHELSSMTLINIGKPAVVSLINALKDNNFEIRQSAAKALGEIGDAKAVEPLIASVVDKDLRLTAVEALVKIGTPSIKPLVAMFSSSDEDTIQVTVEVLQKIGYQPVSQADKISYFYAARKWDELVKIGQPALDALINNALNNNSLAIRQSAAKALGEIGDSRAVEPLIESLKDINLGVQNVAIEALTKIGSPAVEALITALNVGDWFIQEKIAIILGMIKDFRAIEYLVDLLNDSKVKKVAFESLIKINDSKAIPSLVAKLRDDNFKERKSVAEILDKLGWKPDKEEDKIICLILQGKINEITKSGASAVELLISILNVSDSGMKITIAEALGAIKDNRAVKPLIELLKDPISSVKNAAFEALIELGYRPASVADQISFFFAAKKWDELVKIGKPAVEILIAALYDAEIATQVSAAQALGEIKDYEAIKPLIELLDDNNVSVQAVSSLVNIGKLAVEPLIAALKNENSFIREKAAEALGEIGDTSAVEHLIIALQDKDSIVRLAAVRAVAKLQDFKIVEPLIAVASEDKDANVRKFAIEALGNAKEAKSLIEILKDKNSSIRMTTVNALAKLNDYKIVEPLIAVALEDEDPNVQRVATDSVISLKSVVVALMESDSTFRAAATASLAKIDEIIKAKEEKERAEAEIRAAEEARRRTEEERRKIEAERIAEAERERIKPHWKRGLEYAESGRYEEAIECYNQELRINPNDSTVRHLLSVAREHVKQAEEGKEILKRILGGRKGSIY